MPIYMELEGIKGEVTEKGHEKWIEVNSLQFGVSRNLTHDVGARGAAREHSHPQVSDITVTKTFDSSSPAIFKWSVGGTSAKKIKFDLVTVGGDKSHTYSQIELENVLISGYSMSTGGESKPIESLSINFTKIMLKYHPQDEKGKAGTPQSVSYDLATAKTA